ncbi:hypothetical protein [Anaerotignum sp.]
MEAFLLGNGIDLAHGQPMGYELSLLYNITGENKSHGDNFAEDEDVEKVTDKILKKHLL